MPTIKVVGTKLDFRGFTKDQLPPTATVQGPVAATAAASPFALAHAVEVCPAVVQLDQTCKETMLRWRKAQARLKELQASYATAKDYPCKTEPWPHQKAAYELIDLVPVPCLLMEPGTGKTKVAVDWLSNNPGDINLVVCPKGVIDVWVYQVGVHASTDFDVIPLHGMAQPKTEAAFDRALKSEKPVILLVNYEKSWRPYVRALLMANHQRITAVVLDEAHKVKNSGGKAAKFLHLLFLKLKNAKKIALTGTPIPESPLDAFGLMKVMDQNIFGTSKARFDDRYAKTIQISPYVSKVIALKNQEELAMKLGWVSIQVPNTVLNLPEQRHIHVPFDLPPKVLAMYKEFKEELVTEINGKYLTAPSRMAALTKLQQIAGGFLIRSEEDGIVDHLHDAKLDAFCDLLTSLEGRNVVVFVRYRAEIKELVQASLAMGRKVGEISGSRNDYLGWSRGDYDTLVCQVNAAATGIDLTRASYNIYYSMTFSNADYVQSVARTHRAGQENKVLYYYLSARGTVDESIYRALQNKQEVVEACLKLARQPESQL